jgi:hypothetical protein
MTLNREQNSIIARVVASLINRRFLICSAALLLAALLLGCLSPNKPEAQAAAEQSPTAAFDEICSRSLADDLQFVRGKISPQLLVQAAGEAAGPRADQFVREMMVALRVCRPLAEEKGAAAGKVVLQVAGVKESSVRQYSIDLTHDQQHGWQIASKLYGEKPISPAQPPKP